MTSERLVRSSNNLTQGQAAGKEALRGWCIIALLYEYVVVDVSSILDSSLPNTLKTVKLIVVTF